MSARSSRQFFWTFFWMPLLCRVPRPCNGTSTPPSLVVTLAPDHSTLQWHPPIAPSPPTIAHYNGTLRWHPAVAPRPLHPAMAPWCHVQSAKVVRRPPPLLEVRTPIAIAIWGIMLSMESTNLGYLQLVLQKLSGDYPCQTSLPFSLYFFTFSYFHMELLTFSHFPFHS